MAASCVPIERAEPPEESTRESNAMTIFFTGSELGELKPCGCSGGQLGGLDRRAAILDSVPEQSRLIIDTGSFVEGQSEQDLIKFNILVQGLDLLDYDLIHLTEHDIETARNLGLLGSINSVLNAISAEKLADADIRAKFSTRLALRDRTVAVTVAACDAESAATERIEELFGGQDGETSIRIVIWNDSYDMLPDSLIRGDCGVDCVVYPSDSDEPRIIGDANQLPLVFSVGRYGRYVCRLQIVEPVAEPGELTIDFRAIPVTEDLPPKPSLVRLYKDYQQIVKERDLLEKYPRFVLPDDLQYVGSQSCEACHAYEYEKWSSKAHAKAYATLVEVGSQYDPECVICHVVGMEYEGGFISEEQTSHLKDVGCENCHGPGSEHVETAGKAKTGGPQSSCVDCHTPEKSTQYAGNEQLYLQKIVHWREPNAPDNVE
jgi:hypothetical protein